MNMRIDKDNLVIEDNEKEFEFPRGALMLSHRDLNYLKPTDSRLILHRYLPKNLRYDNKLLQTNRFTAIKASFHTAAIRTRNTVNERTENSLIFPCHKFSQIPYGAITEDILRRCISLQEEINRMVAIVPLFGSQLSVKLFRGIEQMFNKIVSSTEILRGAFIPSGFLRDSRSLTVLRQSEFDFLFLNAWGINYRNLENFYGRLDKLLRLEKPVFVTDAVLFTGEILFGPQLADTGICGYSLPFFDRYIPEEPTYYDVSSAVNGRRKNRKTMVTYYKSEDFPLSNICNCSICEENTIRTFFSERGLKPWEKNRLHKLEFAEISSSEEGYRSSAEAIVP